MTHWSQTSDRISQSSRSRIQQQQPQQQDSRTATQQQQQQQQRQRVWSENVDLPYILSGYVQVALNTAVAGVFLYLLYNFIITIQSDVTLRMESMLEREINARQQCNKDFADLNCQLFNKRTSESCREIVDCLSRPEPRISRASVAAETFALIVNAFVHTMSYKTMAFVMVLVFGGLYVSNQAISSYRSNHILHHQHTIVPSASSSSSQSSQQQPQQHIQSNGGFSRRLGQREESNLPLRSTQYRSNEHQQQQNALQRHGSIGSPRPLLLSNSSDEDL
ncbi:hypothetical protein BGZ83_006988 [Gryganskiella cystojenkinii]|nr:hypothetical protein BGZ83_006988 [Gryganskiella cystojenkinii]